MITRSGTKLYFFRSLRINFRAACLFRLDWISTKHQVEDRVDRAPQVDHSADDFQIRFVQMPRCMRLGAAFARIRCNDRPEMLHPAPLGLVQNNNPALRQQVFDIAKA